MRVFKFNICNRKCDCASIPDSNLNLNTNPDENKDYVAHFDFDDEWNNKQITARFKRNGKYVDVILDDSRECTIPHEIVKEGTIEVGCYCSKYATTPAKINFGKSILTGYGVPKEPTQDVYSQLTYILENDLIPIAGSIFNFVTPESYGAIGDGNTDDTTAFTNALATGLPVVGDRLKTYYVHDLNVNSKLINCRFTGKGNDTCIIIKSFAIIDYCYITGYDIAITCNSTVVHSVVKHSLITYCHKGIYLPMQELTSQSGETYSLNNLVINNNYFCKCGQYIDDYSHTYTDPENSAIYMTGNMCGVVIQKNVFEYNSYCGIYFKNENMSYIIGVTIIGNYFEGNKFSPIYLKTTLTTNHINITANYFSRINTNVHNTRWIAHDVFYSTCVVEDHRKLSISLCTAGGNNLIKENHTVVIDENTISQYLALASSMTFEINEPAKIVFKCESIANGKTAILLRNNTNKETLATFDGNGEALISGSSFYLNRMPIAGDKIVIYYYGKAY